MSRTALFLLISSTSIGLSSQRPSASHNTLRRAGDMPSEGQKTSSKLLRGILVSLLSFAVALINSTTVLRRSLFSTGSLDRKE